MGENDRKLFLPNRMKNRIWRTIISIRMGIRLPWVHCVDVASQHERGQVPVLLVRRPHRPRPHNWRLKVSPKILLLLRLLLESITVGVAAAAGTPHAVLVQHLRNHPYRCHCQQEMIILMMVMTMMIMMKTDHLYLHWML